MNVGLKDSRRRDDTGIAIHRVEITSGQLDAPDAITLAPAPPLVGTASTSVNDVIGEFSPLQLKIQLAQFVVLNERWRVRLNDPAQWILEYRLGRPTRKSTGNTGRSYCNQRRTLLRDIHDYCGNVDPNALAQVKMLPERFPYRAARRA